MKGKLYSILATLILPIALFVISPYWGSYFSDKKELSYEVLAQRELTNLGSATTAWPGIKILYQDQDVSTGSFLTLAITNTGKLPIKREDFDNPIVVHVPDSNSLLSYKTIYSHPSNLDITLSKVKEGFKIAPMLLNPGDSFFIEIFSKSPLEIKDVTSRIVGIPNISQEEPESHSGFYIGLSSLGQSKQASEGLMSSIPFWLVFAVTHVLLIGTLLNVWIFQNQTTIVEKASTFIFSAVTYLLSLAGFTLSVSYFVEVLNIKKWPGLAILIGSIMISALVANSLRRRFKLLN